MPDRNLCTECQMRRDNGAKFPDGLTLIEEGKEEPLGSGTWHKTSIYQCDTCSSRWNHMESKVGANFKRDSIVVLADD